MHDGILWTRAHGNPVVPATYLEVWGVDDGCFYRCWSRPGDVILNCTVLMAPTPTGRQLVKYKGMPTNN